MQTLTRCHQSAFIVKCVKSLSTCTCSGKTTQQKTDYHNEANISPVQAQDPRPAQQPPQRKSTRMIQCFRCGEQGHRVTDCKTMLVKRAKKYLVEIGNCQPSGEIIPQFFTFLENRFCSPSRRHYYYICKEICSLHLHAYYSNKMYPHPE